jgi:hypothetical protein
MRCRNCHTVVMDGDRACPSCRALIAAPGSRQADAGAGKTKPFFAVIFLVCGSAAYNFAYPTSKAVAASGGGINMQHALMAGVVGGVCAVVGGLFDYLLSGGRGPRT